MLMDPRLQKSCRKKESQLLPFMLYVLQELTRQREKRYLSSEMELGPWSMILMTKWSWVMSLLG